jgi:hypothetical protein
VAPDPEASAGNPPAQPRSTGALLDELSRRIRAAERVLARLADDMAAAGVMSAFDRTERARAELRLAGDLAAELLRRGARGADASG